MATYDDAWSQALETLRLGGVLSWSPRSRVELRGKDRAQLLQGLCTNDVKCLEPGDCREAFFCQHQGKILAHGFIECEADRLVIDTVAGQAESLLKHLDRYIIREDVQLADCSHEHRAWVFARQAGQALRSGLEASGGEIVERLGVKPRWRACPWDQNGTSLLVAAPADAPSSVLDALRNLARNTLAEEGLDDDECERRVRLLDESGYELWRVLERVPLYGRDMTLENFPQELGRDASAISFTKGCYLGQETVSRIDAKGHVNWNFVSFLARGASSTSECVAGQVLAVQEKPALRVTTAVYVPSLRGVLGLGYVRQELRRAARPQISCPISEGVLATSIGDVLVNPQVLGSETL